MGQKDTSRQINGHGTSNIKEKRQQVVIVTQSLVSSCLHLYTHTNCQLRHRKTSSTYTPHIHTNIFYVNTIYTHTHTCMHSYRHTQMLQGHGLMTATNMGLTPD